MVEEAYITASLDDEKAKEIGQVIANPTCRKILNLLSEKNLTETDISTELNLPLSTVHYNIQQLLKSGIVETKKFYYSSKGNKINVYTLARKIILIAPKGVEMRRSKLRSLLPSIFITFAISVFIKIFFSNLYTRFYAAQEATIEKVAIGISEAAAPLSKPIITTYLPSAQAAGNGYAIAFFIGSLLALVIFLAIEKIKQERKIKIK